MADRTPLLEMKGVSYSYPGAGTRLAALDGIDLVLRRGEKVALLGANGSGKSTLLSLTNGILRPGRGVILHDGVRLTYGRKDLQALRRAVAMVFQDPDDQIFAGSVFEDVAYGPSNLGWSVDRIRQSASGALEAAGIAGLGSHSPQALSHGTRKKVALAGALAVDPELLVLDEPTAGLDPASEDELEAILTGIAAKGTGVLLSTHDVDFAAAWADRVVLLGEGRILADGRCSEVMSERELLRACRLRVPRKYTGMARTGVREVSARPDGVHVVRLHPSSRFAADRVARATGAVSHAHLDDVRSGERGFERVAERLSELWDCVSELVLFMPVGVAVRSIAPLVRHKLTDPAVVCCDVHGRWAVSLLSGHEGGANDLAALVSRILEAEPVVTTTSEAARIHVAGVGCRKGAGAEAVLEALDEGLRRIGLVRADLRSIATTEAKRDEPGIAEAARELGVPLRIVSHREVRTLVPRVRRSAASRHFNVPAVSEPAALLSGRRTECVLRKFKHGGVTISVARELCGWSESDPDTGSTAPCAPSRPSPPPES